MKINPSVNTYLSTAKAWAPGHKLLCMTAIAYCDTSPVDLVALQAVWPLTSVKTLHQDIIKLKFKGQKS